MSEEEFRVLLKEFYMLYDMKKDIEEDLNIINSKIQKEFKSNENYMNIAMEYINERYKT